jgi:large subunit ribosomal protein L10
MPTTKKVKIVESLTEKISRAKGVIFTDFRGLSHPQMQKLRENLLATGAEYLVAKNTLLKIALAKSSYPVIEIVGPTAILLAYQNELASLRVVAEFAQETSLPAFKGGFLEKRFIEALRLKELANIPGIDYLRNLLVSSLQAPINNLVNGLNWDLNNLISVLNRVKEKRAQS